MSSQSQNEESAEGMRIPVLSVGGRTVPEAWEAALLAVWDRGLEIRTEYDRADDPPSLDATVMVEVREPMGEPRVHKNFPGGPNELEIYRQEVLAGIHDHWIAPQDGKWTYTYHQRLFAYRARQDLENPDEQVPFESFDQVAWMVEKLSRVPYTRRAQAITWIPHCDPETDDPPCLQRLWGRLVQTGEGRWELNLNAHWRSRDLYKAWFMNVFAITDLQRWMAEQIASRIGEEVGCGRYVDVCDSLHIYGSYRNEKLTDEIRKMKASPYTDRAWDSAVLEPMFEEVRENLKKDPDHYQRGDV